MPTPTASSKTLLGRQLARIREGVDKNATSRRATPIDAFNLALRKWIDGERVEITRLANELGVGRATVYRWVGSREQLIGEVIWHLCAMLWEDVLKDARGEGADYIADVAYQMMDRILAAEPLRHFLNRDPEYALRILTSKTSAIQSRIVAEVAKALSSQKSRGYIDPSIDIDNLAYLIIRIMESFVYSDQITGRQPDIEIARKAVLILVDERTRSHDS
jgi:AcrR family transcriptional regulator